MSGTSILGRMAVVAACLALALLAVGSPAARADGAPHLLKDINTRGAGSLPSPTVDVNGTGYVFACPVQNEGQSLGTAAVFRTDGTPAGTQMLAQIGTCANGWVAGATDLNGKLYFLTDSSLWVSDGTTGGTFAIAEAVYGFDLAKVGSSLYFLAQGLWKSDGTVAGTVNLNLNRDFIPEDLTPAGSLLFFEDVLPGTLWKSDGTAAGTMSVQNAPQNIVRDSITAVGSRVFFTVRIGNKGGGADLWTSDGTGAGTHRVKDIDPTRLDHVSNLAAVGNRLYFQARDGSHGYELWKTDGTAAGTAMVKDIRSGAGSSNPSGIVDVAGNAYYTANDGVHGRSLWRTDGTALGTKRIKNVVPTVSQDQTQQVALGSLLYFSANGPEGTELWRSDGTSTGTKQVADINPTGDSSPTWLSVVGGRLFFRADDGVHGDELWVSDGTATGTELAADLDPADVGSAPHVLGVLGNTALLAADDGTHGAELWKTNGTVGATALVKDINPGAPSGLGIDWSETNTAVAGGNVYFLAQDGPAYTNYNLWKSDGTAAGTTKVANTGWVDDLTPFGTRLLYVDDDGALWISSGTAANTLRLRLPDGFIRPIIPAGSIAYFFEHTNCYYTCDVYLWKTDGTTAGTKQVSTIAFDDSWDPVGAFFGGKFYFCPSNGGEPGYGGLWRSDGTATGTKKWLDVDCTWLKVAGSRLYFGYTEWGETAGGTLWTSDGTKAGTSMLHQFSAFDPATATPVGSSLFVAASDETSESGQPADLWRSDGTVAGTACVTEGVVPTDLATVGNKLYFSSSDTNGREPWASDGTPAGTRLVTDILPGTDGSYPTDFTALGSNVLFAANDGTNGRELWIMPAQ